MSRRQVQDEEDIGTLKLAPEQMAVTVANAFFHASGCGEPSWDALSDDEQQRWLKLAVRGPLLMQTLEGQNFHAVGTKLASFWAGDDGRFYNSLLPRMKTAWQAVARHLTTLLDCEADQIGPLSILEASWGPWAARKTEQCA